MSEPYKKVGRGGAGNFYTKKDVEDVKGKGKAVVWPLFFLTPETFQFSIVFHLRAISNLDSVPLSSQLL